MQFHFHRNQSHFRKNGFALRLALEQRHKGTRNDLFLYGLLLSLWCFSILVNYYLQVFDLKVIFDVAKVIENAVTELLQCSVLLLSLDSVDKSPFLTSKEKFSQEQM